MIVRIRIPELLEERSMSPYELSKRSEGKISMSTAYRLNRMKGNLHTFDGAMLEVLCDIFGVTPGALLERDRAGKALAKKKRAR